MNILFLKKVMNIQTFQFGLQERENLNVISETPGIFFFKGTKMLLKICSAEELIYLLM